MSKTLIKRPKDLPKTNPSVFSNFDHTIHSESLKLVEAGTHQGQHAAWDFCGWVWYDVDKKKWFEEIWRHAAHVETLEGDTFREVIDEAIDRFGSA